MDMQIKMFGMEMFKIKTKMEQVVRKCQIKEV